MIRTRFFPKQMIGKFLRRILELPGRHAVTDDPISTQDVSKLGWLADAPLFIDNEQVTAFYDAVVRPEAEQKTITLSLKSLESQKTTLGGSVTATVSVAKWLTTIFPFLDARVEGKAEVSSEAQHGTEETRVIELQSINSPQRQLVQLMLHYILRMPTRITVVSDPLTLGWYDENFIQDLPRALVFLDFPKGTAFIPMATELDSGKVVRIFDELAKVFAGAQENPNPRPNAGALTEDQRIVAWQRYWAWYAEHFDPLKTMDTVEALIGNGGRIRWIDYRVPLAESDKTIHLHVAGRGIFDTGVFAYNLIQRGHRHGLRLVGTMKSGPDINVLAVFEK
jgi:hypothetical protein